MVRGTAIRAAAARRRCRRRVLVVAVDGVRHRLPRVCGSLSRRGRGLSDRSSRRAPGVHGASARLPELGAGPLRVVRCEIALVMRGILHRIAPRHRACRRGCTVCDPVTRGCNAMRSATTDVTYESHRSLAGVLRRMASVRCRRVHARPGVFRPVCAREQRCRRDADQLTPSESHVPSLSAARRRPSRRASIRKRTSRTAGKRVLIARSSVRWTRSHPVRTRVIRRGPRTRRPCMSRSNDERVDAAVDSTTRRPRCSSTDSSSPRPQELGFALVESEASGEPERNAVTRCRHDRNRGPRACRTAFSQRRRPLPRQCNARDQ